VALAGSGARRYAEALLEIATAERAVPAYRRSLEDLAAAFDAETVRVLRDARVPLERRRQALRAATKDQPKAIRAVLEMLLERDRVAIVGDIARAFSDLVDRREGILKAKITTPVALSDAQEADLVRRLEESSGRKIRAVFAVDEALIGGAKVQVGDRLIDASLRTQLDTLARQLAG
jgi:F-type H+-transporting ATPase subunit delta